jgi:hypothetical protein
MVIRISYVLSGGFVAWKRVALPFIFTPDNLFVHTLQNGA